MAFKSTGVMSYEDTDVSQITRKNYKININA